jgi:dienelactone hydrolase
VTGIPSAPIWSIRTPAARGAIVIVQEIFGLTQHIRHVADSYAADGYLTIAPALFDRVRRDVVLGYSAAEVEQAKGYRLQVPLSKALLDIAAAARWCATPEESQPSASAGAAHSPGPLPAASILQRPCVLRRSNAGAIT